VAGMNGLTALQLEGVKCLLGRRGQPTTY
jgi:hypothetical protein